MTQAVITSTDRAVIVREDKTSVILTGQMGPRGQAGNLSTMGDVDLTNLQAGSLLVYNQLSGKWTSTTLLNQQSVDCGEF